MKTYYVSSTLCDDNEYSNGIVIRGLSSIATGIKFLTPCKAVTTISEQQLEILKNIPTFRRHEEKGFITVAADYPCEPGEEPAEQKLYNEQTKEVFFQGVGPGNKHDNNLFKVFETPTSLENLCELKNLEKVITNCFRQARSHLERRGIDDPYGFFYVQDREIKKWDENVSDFPRMHLHAAIQECDENKQTGDYLAASIIYYLPQIDTALLDLAWNGEILEPTRMMRQFYSILDHILHIQNLSFCLYQREHIQAPYSAGVGRGRKGDSLKACFYNIALQKLHSYIKQGHRRENAYRLIEEKLKNEHPNQRTPKASAIKSWLKSIKLQ